MKVSTVQVPSKRRSDPPILSPTWILRARRASSTLAGERRCKRYLGPTRFRVRAARRKTAPAMAIAASARAKVAQCGIRATAAAVPGYAQAAREVVGLWHQSPSSRGSIDLREGQLTRARCLSLAVDDRFFELPHSQRDITTVQREHDIQITDKRMACYIWWLLVGPLFAYHFHVEFFTDGQSYLVAIIPDVRPLTRSSLDDRAI